MSITAQQISALNHTKKSLHGRRERRLQPVLAPAVAAIALVVSWSLTAYWANSAVYPGPLAALQGLIDDLARPQFRANLLSSVSIFLVVYLAAIAVGVVAGLLVGLSRFWSKVLLTLVHALNGIPRVVFYPIFLLILGAGAPSLGGFAFACGVLPMFLIAAEAVSAVSALHLKLAASLQLSRISLMRKIVVPSVTPALIGGARVAFGLTLVGLLVAELFAASTGLGAEILRAVGQVKMQNILGQVLLIGALAVIPTLILRRLEARSTRRFGS